MDQSSPSTTRCVALLCFLPDTGHVTQLLQLGRLIADVGGARVVCFVPGKFADLVASFGFECVPLSGLEAGSSAQIIGRLARQSIFRNAFSDDEDLREFYWAPLHAAASSEIATLAHELRQLRPALILADNHVFADAYRCVAVGCGARLVLNRGTGSLVSRHRPFVRAYGLTALPGAIQLVVETIGFLSMRLRGRWRRLRHADRVAAAEACEALLARSIAESFSEVAEMPAVAPVITASCGLCALEAEMFPGAATLPRPDEVFLAPMPAAPGPLPDGLRCWLASQPRGRIVYVAFGTMVQPSTRLLRNLLRGLAKAEVSVLWALPVAQRARLDMRMVTDRFRFEAYVPQASLLQSGMIDCFVTHAGNSSVQEALAGGVPMLCLPFLWDQPYTASLVAQMGAGIRASCRWSSVRGLARDVRRLIYDPRYARRAAEIGSRLRELRARPAQTAWISGLFADAETAGSASR